ncbi:MAG: DUF3833 domain-containing protein [Halioglobus sp.]|nr:DUF3833 domain-containing protein [Halioglobus sp.]
MKRDKPQQRVRGLTLLETVGLVMCLAAAACSPVSINDYENFRPRMSLEEFFDGSLTAYGVVKDRAGKVIRTFSASIEASWEDGTGRLEEDFLFNDGERQRRDWVLSPLGDGSFSGTAGDVVGEGRLQVVGNSVFLHYVLRIPYGESEIDVWVDDRMYRVAAGVLLNESELRKFGVRVGSLQLVILRRDLL